MNEDERLREALLELDALRKREAERSRESGAILSALEAMTAAKGAVAGIEALLRSIQGSIDCDFVALFDCQNDTLVLRNTSGASLDGLTWVAPGLQTRRRRIVDLSTVSDLWATPPAAFAEWRAMLSVPLSDGNNRMVLAAFASARAAFDSSDADLLHRLAAVASQAIIQRALEQRGAFLAAVIDKSPVSVAIADIQDDMPLVYVNDAFVEMTGYSREDVIGTNCRFLSAEPPNAHVRLAIRQTVKDRTDGTFLVRNKRKSGEEFWNDLRLFPVRDESGVVTQMVATQSDATARVTAEMERDNARRRLEAALSATSEGFLVLGQSGKVRFANAEFIDLFGDEIAMSDQHLPRATVAKFLGLPTLTETDDLLDHLSQPFNRELTARRGRQVLLRGRPISEGGVVLSATDITQTKVNERILRQRLAAVEMSQDGIAIGDPEGRVLHANPSLVALWGIADENSGLGRKWSSFYDLATQERFAADATAFANTGVWRGEARFQNDQNNSIHDVSLSRVPDVGTVLLVRDVTDRHAAEEDRNRLRIQLDRAQMQERISQVSAGLAHDFNNLLSAILGSATLIDGLNDVPEAAQKAAGRISTAAERAASLVDGFLDLSLRERSAEKLDLGEMLATTVDLAQGGAPPNAALTIALPAERVIVEASQTDLLQVFLNLVVNGIEALEGEDGTVSVSLSPPTEIDSTAPYVAGTVLPGTRYAAIVIEDTGKGMDKETISKMLEPYFTTKGNDGTGLGLSIVFSMLSGNGCVLGLTTKVGTGSRFTVYWPVDTDAEETPRQIKGQSRQGLPIMVVDDQPDVAAAIAADLTNAGFEVAETTDPETALEAILENPGAWACLVTDYDMPSLTGGDLVVRLAKDAPEVPVIVVSALARRITDPRVKAANAVLSKPVKAANLIDAVNKALNAQEQEADDAYSSRG